MLGKDIKQNGLGAVFPPWARALCVSEGGKGDVFANHKFTPWRVYYYKSAICFIGFKWLTILEVAANLMHIIILPYFRENPCNSCLTIK